MSDTMRGLILFLSGVLTIFLWMPVSNRAVREADGTIVTETYFGPVHYLVLHTVLKEPKYSITPELNYARLAINGVITIVLWTGVIWSRHRTRPGNAPSGP